MITLSSNDAHCNGFFARDAYTRLWLPYNSAHASKMERLVATDAVRPADWHTLIAVANLVGPLDSGGGQTLG